MKVIELEKVKEESRMKYLKERELRELKLKQAIQNDEEKLFAEEEITKKEKEMRDINKGLLKAAEVQKDNDVVVDYYK